jgi:hypothetical protein
VPPVAKKLPKVGDKFWNLEILALSRHNGANVVTVRCDCGTVKECSPYPILKGMTKSCGCLAAAQRTTHGMSRTPEYLVWQNMRFRCEKPRLPEYRNYGARGIYVVDRWKSFEAFYADVGRRPSPKHSIGRIDNDGPYAPDNCRWETAIQQRNNTRTNFIIPLLGKTIAQVAREYDISSTTLHYRARHNWPLERMLSKEGLVAGFKGPGA